MSRAQHLSRRTVLRGLGCAIALPWFEAMGTSNSALAAAASPAAKAAGLARPPVRAAFFFMPNGVNMEHWRPASVGPLGELPPSLAPLAKVKGDLTVLSGLALDGARAKGDGPGDHARSAAAFLTGAHPHKTAGADIRNGVSVDQLAAQAIGSATRLPSIELGLDKTQLAGNCDSGYSCAYVSNISWRSETTPVPKEVDPGALFDRLFGTGAERDKALAAHRQARRKSILDFVQEDARRLDAKLGKNDQRKLDEYLASIREIERRIETARREADRPVRVPTGVERPDGIPREFTEHMKLMMDLLVLAFQTDTTRVATFMIGRDGSDRQYRWLGVSEGHHTISHHGRNSEKIANIRKIDLYHMQQFAYFLERMKATKEANGASLLDNSMVMLGSGISDGDRHNHNDLPVLLAGRGGGLIKPGRHLTYPRDTPLCNLYVTMLNALGVKAQRFGDSDRALTEFT